METKLDTAQTTTPQAAQTSASSEPCSATPAAAVTSATAAPAANAKTAEATPSGDAKPTATGSTTASNPKSPTPKTPANAASTLAPESERPSDALSLRVHFSFRMVKPDGTSLITLNNSVNLPFALDPEQMPASVEELRFMLKISYSDRILSRYFAHVRDHLEKHAATKGKPGSAVGPTTWPVPPGTSPNTFNSADPNSILSAMKKPNEENFKISPL